MSMEIAAEYFQFNYLPIGVFIINDEFEVLFWNDCIERWTGVENSIITSNNLSAFFPKFSLPIYSILLNNVFKEGKNIVFSSELHPNLFQTKKSTTLRFHTTVTPIENNDQRGYNALFSVQNQTTLSKLVQNNKVLHKELVDLNNTLEEKILTRTIDLEQVIANHKLEENLQLAKLNLIEFSNTNTFNESLKQFLQVAKMLSGSKFSFYNRIDTKEKRFGLVSWVSDSNEMDEFFLFEGEQVITPTKGFWEQYIDDSEVSLQEFAVPFPFKEEQTEPFKSLNRMLIIPIVREKRVTALFGVANKQYDYTDLDIKTTREIANLAWETFQRRKAEDALKESHEKYYTVAEFTNDWEYWVLPDGSFEYVSPSCERITGYSKDEFMENPYLINEIIHSEDKKIWEKHASINRNCQEELIFRIVTKKGEIRWVGHYCKSVFGRDGRYLGIRGSNRDITNKRLMEIELKEKNEQFESLNEELTQANMQLLNAKQRAEQNEHKFMAIFLGAPLGIFMMTNEGRFIEVNKALAKILGYNSPKEVVSEIENCHEQFYAEKGTHQRILDQLSKTGILKFETTLLRKNVEFHANIYVSEVTDGNGALILVGIIEDATQFKSIETLSKEVELQKHLAETQKIFLANMSHEIRTPMNGIIGMLELMENTLLNDIQKDYLGVMKNSANTLLNIINDILDLSKIEAGKLAITKKGMEFYKYPSLIEGIYNSIKGGKDIDFKVRFSEHLPKFIISDDKRLMQIISNLLSNAVKFTEKGCIEVSFSQISDENEILTIKVEVIDTGIGISNDNQKKLFDKFYQANSAPTKRVDGTGLGLAISKELVKMLNGEIGVESQKGVGSNFWFTFKAEKSSDVETFEVSNNVIESGCSFNCRILMVEDIVVNQVVLKLMLEKVGCKVTIANNGLEALKVFEEGKFGIILMDIQMPVMDGIELTKTLREKYSNLPPIIGLSANAMEGDAEKYISLGMDDYLTKPVISKDLIGKLSFWLKKELK